MADTAVEVEPVEAEPIPATESIADHQAQYGRERVTTEADDLDDAKPAHHAAVQRRERDTGKFNGGMKPGPKPKQFDQSEVDEATRRLKTAEEPYFKEIPQKEGESDRAYRLRVRAEVIERHSQTAPKVKQLEGELERLRAHGAPKTQIQQAERKVEAAGGNTDDPEPYEDDPKYGGDYAKYWDDRTRWAVRDENRRLEAARQARERESAQRVELQKHQETFSARLAAAQAKYPNFNEAADRVIQRVPEDSPIDDWFRRHPRAEDVVWFLDSHPEELDAILQVNEPIQQYERLTLLAQRFASPSQGTAGSTGSAPERTIKQPLPKPPNPVRTEAQRANDAPPPTDGSLGSIDAHRRHFQPKKR